MFFEQKAEKGRKSKRIKVKLSKKTCFFNLHPNAGQGFIPRKIFSSH